jgi:spore coat polysaccharide biosynthesis predicted glycosyltransferase SpsG
MKLLIRLSANHRIGLGHAVRIGGLMEILTTAPDLVVVGEGDLWRPFLPQARHRPVADDDLAALAAVIDDERPDAVLVDFPWHSPEMWQTLRRCKGPLIVIDDEGGFVPADLVINGTVLPDYHHYTGLSGPALVGAHYTLLRPPFGATPWRGTPGKLICVVGSGEDARLWGNALPRLIQQSGQTFTETVIVVGGAFPDGESLRADAGACSIAVLQNLSAQDLASAMAGAEMAIITGGMIVYEALAVGVPAIVFPQIPNLVAEAHWFAAHGAIIDLGIHGGHDADKLGTAIAHLRQPGQAATLSAAAQAIIDGAGLARVAAAVDSVLQEG